MKTRLLQAIDLRWMDREDINEIRYGPLDDHYNYFWWLCQIFIYFQFFTKQEGLDRYIRSLRCEKFEKILADVLNYFS